MRMQVASIALLLCASASATPIGSHDDDAVVASMALPAVSQGHREETPALERGHAVLEGADPSGAVSLLRLAVEEEVGSLRSLRALGIAAALSGELVEAEAALLRAASLEPTHADTIEVLAIVRFRQRDFQGAASMFERVLRVDPERGSAWLGLGRAKMGSGAAESALNPLERAMILGVPGAREARIEALRSVGRRAEARRLRRSVP